MSLSAPSRTAPRASGCARVELARDPLVRREASELVDRRYDLDLNLSPPDAAEAHAPRQTLTVVARAADGRVIATCSLTSPVFFPGEAPRELELESTYQLDSLGIPRARLAEVNRVAALPEQRAAVLDLYAYARCLCLSFGVHSWLGLVEGGDSLDAASVLRAAYAQRLTAYPLPLLTQLPNPLADALRDSTTPFSDLTQKPKLPHRVAQFAADIAARVVGIPTRHPVYPRLVVPMLADLRRAFPFESQEIES